MKDNPDILPLVICICGKAQHGKSTAGDMLRAAFEEKGKKVLIINYADLLKFICSKYFGWNGKKDDKGRSLLQHVGTDCVRAQQPDFWVDFVANVIHLFRKEWDVVIIPDTRFPNEFEKLKNAGYPTMLVKIERPGFDNGLSEKQQKHPSETALDNTVPDLIVSNKGSLNDLNETIKSIASSLLKKGNTENDNHDNY